MKILDSPSSPMFGGNITQSEENTDEFDQLKRILFKESKNKCKEISFTDIDQSSSTSTNVKKVQPRSKVDSGLHKKNSVPMISRKQRGLPMQSQKGKIRANKQKPSRMQIPPAETEHNWFAIKNDIVESVNEEDTENVSDDEPDPNKTIRAI